MNKYRYLLFVTFFIFSCIGDGKQSYINRFDRFIKNVEFNQRKFDNQQWAIQETKYKRFVGMEYDKYKTELTSEENTHINELIGKYNSIRVKDNILDVKDKVSDIIEQSSSFVEELVEDSSKAK